MEERKVILAWTYAKDPFKATGDWKLRRCDDPVKVAVGIQANSPGASFMLSTDGGASLKMGVYHKVATIKAAMQAA